MILKERTVFYKKKWILTHFCQNLSIIFPHLWSNKQAWISYTILFNTTLDIKWTKKSDTTNLKFLMSFATVFHDLKKEITSCRTSEIWHKDHCTHFFIGHSIFHLSLELLTKFRTTSLKVAYRLLSFVVDFYTIYWKSAVFDEKVKSEAGLHNFWLESQTEG